MWGKLIEEGYREWTFNITDLRSAMIRAGYSWIAFVHCWQPTYWANARQRETIKKSIENSICFGIYADHKQIGFARCVTDYATMYWLADVIIDDQYRRLGLGKALVNSVVHHEQLKALVGILATNDAHGLYQQFGFQLTDGKYMRRPIK